MYKIYENIDVFLQDSKNNTIVFCVANNAVLDMVKNLLYSAVKNSINIVVFALDNEIVNNLKDLCDIVKYYDNGFGGQNSKDKFYRYGTEAFKNVIFQRFFIGNEILKVNKSYIYLDTDVVVTKNFVDDILEQYKNTNYDCLSQFNGTDCCTGFFSMIPNKKTKEIDLNFFKKHNYEKYNLNQPFFNGIILKNKILNIKFLNRSHYPNGRFYYDNYNKIKNVCYIVHYNGIIGYDTKIKKMKFYNNWFISN
tara:strand:- start:997 stop:1749 length:753 start_codon:yes stop_codon:yes gene_type:complete